MTSKLSKSIDNKLMDNMFVKLDEFWGITADEIKSRSRNYYLGVSINNKYFDKLALGNFIDWGIKYTNQEFAVLIVDTPQVFNNMIFERMSYEKALEKAMLKAESIEKTCLELRKGLQSHERKKFVLLRWSDISSDSDYINNLNVVNNEFETNELFADFVIGKVKKSLGEITNRIHKPEDINTLAKYLLAEIPTLITGINYGGARFNASVYPGDLKSVAQIREMDFFKPALEKMKLNHSYNGVLKLYVK